MKRIREESKGLDYIECMQKCREEYAGLDAAGKALYKQLHVEDKKRYAMEMATYHRHNMDENEDGRGT